MSGGGRGGQANSVWRPARKQAGLFGDDLAEVRAAPLQSLVVVETFVELRDPGEGSTGR